MFHDMSFMGMWWLWLIILLAVIIIMVYMLNNTRSSISNETPLAILKKRYAKGEINKQEFEEKKRDLER
jgi:putative membrane protein